MRVVSKGKLAKANILSYGQNYYTTNTIINNIHAEHDAINKLPYSRKQKNINILVLRFKKDKKLCMSRPCSLCIEKMLVLFPQKGYIIKDIYYSTNDEMIEKTTLSKLNK